MMIVPFMSDKSGLKTRSLGLNTLGTALSPASSQYVLFSSLSWKILIVSSEKLEKPGIKSKSRVASYTTTARRLLTKDMKISKCVEVRGYYSRVRQTFLAHLSHMLIR